MDYLPIFKIKLEDEDVKKLSEKSPKTDRIIYKKGNEEITRNFEEKCFEFELNTLLSHLRENRIDEIRYHAKYGEIIIKRSHCVFWSSNPLFVDMFKAKTGLGIDSVLEVEYIPDLFGISERMSHIVEKKKRDAEMLRKGKRWYNRCFRRVYGKLD